MRTTGIAKLLLGAAMLGIAARVVLAAMSTGSYDAILWRQFAGQIQDHGLIQLYRANPHFNHPPIAGWWASASLSLANAMHLRFELVFKLPMIGSDMIVSVLLWKIWRKRRASLFASMIVAAYAWNLDAILLSAYHCNTDSIYAMFALLAVYLVEEQRAHLLGGLALAAAINVKLIPVVLIIPMLGAYRDPRLAARFLAGLALGALPFLVPILGAGSAFIHNAIAYTSVPSYWGLNVFLRELTRIPRFSGWAQPIMDRYHELGRWIVLLTIVLVTLILRRKPAADRYVSCAVSATIFLILAPGFGMQYTVFPIPLMMVVAPFFGTLYGALTGIGALFIYWLGWSGSIPFDSPTGMPDDAGPAVQFGLLAWAVLIAFVWKTLRGRDEQR